jgi:hypothetical protein
LVAVGCGRAAVVFGLNGVVGDEVENVCDRIGVEIRVVAGSVVLGGSVSPGDD